MTSWISPRVVVSCLLTAACTHHPQYPVTQESRPFTTLDASLGDAAPSVAQNLTADRISRARAESRNWLTYYGAYDGQCYSALDQITTENVRTLKVAWVFQAGVIGLIANPATYAFEAAPIIIDGVMYVSGWDGYVWALDAATGKVFWRYRHAIPLDVPLCCGNVNRGVAVALGKVFVATPNGHLVALDAATGKPVWTSVFVDVRAGESATLAPLVVRDSCWWEAPEGSTECADTLMRSMSRRDVGCGAATMFRNRANGARKRGHEQATRGRVVVARRGSPGPTIRSSTSCTGAPAIPAPTSTAPCARGTTSTRTPSLRSIRMTDP